MIIIFGLKNYLQVPEVLTGPGQPGRQSDIQQQWPEINKYTLLLSHHQVLTTSLTLSLAGFADRFFFQWCKEDYLLGGGSRDWEFMLGGH